MNFLKCRIGRDQSPKSLVNDQMSRVIEEKIIIRDREQMIKVKKPTFHLRMTHG